MTELEVLVGELLTVDGAATGTLSLSVSFTRLDVNEYLTRTYVAAGEVTTLKHELGDDTVEARALVTFTRGFLAELTEVASGPGDDAVEEVEDDTASLGCRKRQSAN